MSKSSKILVLILSLVAVLLFIVFLFLEGINSSIPKEVTYPPSNLSQSIFDSQNMKYVPNSSLTIQHIYETTPYQFDTVDTDMAKVGDYGAVYKISDTVYVYTTECEETANISSVIKKELSPAVMIDSDTSMSVLDNYVHEEGYSNGFKADYYIDCLTVSNGSRTSSVYLTGYELTVTEEEYDHGYKLFLGIVTAVKDTETFEQAKGLLDTLMNTFQYNAESQEAITRAEKQAEQEAEQEAKLSGTSGSEEKTSAVNDKDVTVTTTDNAQDMASVADAQTAETMEEELPQKSQKTVTIPVTYNGVSLYYYYTNISEPVTVTLYNPDKTESYQPVSNSEGIALFELQQMEPGKWIVEIEGMPGEDSMKLYSDSSN